MGDACTADVDCCANLACIDGSCQVANEPGETPEPPADGDPGAPPDESNDGVTKLPGTGVGSSDDGLNALLGVSLAAGAAALLAARKLRDMAPDATILSQYFRVDDRSQSSTGVRDDALSTLDNFDE